MTNIPHTNNTVKKVLVITDEWLAPSLALEIQNEGHDVVVAMKRPCNILKGTIKRVPYETRLEYAQLCDLVIYEDKSGRGESSDLRKSGISVIGGDKLSDKLELDRCWANDLAGKLGIKIPAMYPVDSFDKIREHIAEHGGKWVLKQQGKIDEIKGLNFVAKMDNSEDLLDYLSIMERNWIDGVKPDFVIQEKVEGHEFAIGSYWNGNEFMKDADGDEICEQNWEHKPLFPGGLGESTGEQYTVMQYVKAKHSKLFKETLDKCRPLLKQIDFRGDFDINCIVNETGAYFLEFTPRLGVPATSAQLEIHQSSWYYFLKAMADGKQTKSFKYSPEFCIVSWLYTKPFPFVNSSKMTALYDDSTKPQGMSETAEVISFRMCNSEGIIVNFKKDFTKEDWKHIHPDGLRFQEGRLKIANPDGYICTVSHLGNTVEGAGEALEEILKKVVVPKIFWRNDFSSSNYHKSKEDLHKWGYLMTEEQIHAAEEANKLSTVQEANKLATANKKEAHRKKVRSTLKKIVYAK
jgi:phosphoribosylamine-glycine ligase